MGVFEMVVAIVAIVITGKIIGTTIKTKHQSGSSQKVAADGATLNRLAEVEKRLIVLEQIVTSEGYELKQQFKNLENEQI